MRPTPPRAIPLRPLSARHARDAGDDDHEDDGGSVQSAVEEVVAAGQQFLLDRLDLWQLEIKEQARRTAEGVALFAVAGLFGLLGLVTLSVGLGLGLARYMPGWAAALSTGGIEVLLAGAAAAVAVARRRQAMVGDAEAGVAAEG